MANGAKLTSDKMISSLTWWTHGQTFTTSARVLNLQHYDMVLGVDSLETFIPMWIHWKKKKMRFTHNKQRVTLVGIKDCTDKCHKLKVGKLKGLLRKEGISQLVQLSPIKQTPLPAKDIESLQKLIKAHEDLFLEPSELPHSREWDHQITLILGATPVNARPYRYSPA